MLPYPAANTTFMYSKRTSDITWDTLRVYTNDLMNICKAIQRPSIRILDLSGTQVRLPHGALPRNSKLH